jgi:RNA polymerase sigma-70 factor, ECF subfamily
MEHRTFLPHVAAVLIEIKLVRIFLNPNAIEASAEKRCDASEDLVVIGRLQLGCKSANSRPCVYMGDTATARRMSTKSDRFVQLLTDCQSRLYAYILSILPNSNAARDVLAETNIKLWAKWQEFDQDRDFATWAFRFAYFEVLTYQKRVRNDRHIFDGDLLAGLADDAVAAVHGFDERLSALENCIQKLPARDRQLIALRYDSQLPVKDIAKRRNKSPNTISHALLRIRAALSDCVRRAVELEGAG